jgi:hypothetical protein
MRRRLASNRLSLEFTASLVTEAVEAFARFFPDVPEMKVDELDARVHTV